MSKTANPNYPKTPGMKHAKTSGHGTHRQKRKPTSPRLKR